MIGGVAQRLQHRVVYPTFVGSNPAVPASFAASTLCGDLTFLEPSHSAKRL